MLDRNYVYNDLNNSTHGGIKKPSITNLIATERSNLKPIKCLICKHKSSRKKVTNVFNCVSFLVHLRMKNSRNTHNNLTSSKYKPPGVSNQNYIIHLLKSLKKVDKFSILYI